MADLHTDLFSIKQIVRHARTEKDAAKSFHNMHGFSLPRNVAHRVFNDEVETKFKKKETQVQGSYLERIEAMSIEE